MDFEHVPVELLFHILKYLDSHELLYLRHVSRFWKVIVDHECQYRGLSVLQLSWFGCSRSVSRMHEAIQNSTKHINVCKYATYSNNLKVLMYFAQYYKLNNQVFKAAAQYGDPEMLDWLNEHDTLTTIDSICIAFKYGRLDNVMWFLKKYHHSEELALFMINKCATALKHGYLDIVKYLFYNRYNFHIHNTIHVIASVPEAQFKIEHLHILKWYLEIVKRVPVHQDILHVMLSDAAYNGNLEILKCIVQYSFDFEIPRSSDINYRQLMQHAIENGHLNIIQYLQIAILFNENNLHMAIQYGHLHIVSWALENEIDNNTHRVQWIPDIMTEIAVLHDRIDILEYAHNNGYHVINVMSTAAFHGQISVLNWGKSVGYPLHRTLYEDVSDLSTLKWLYYNGCPWDHRLCQYFRRTTRVNGRVALNWIHSLPRSQWPCTMSTMSTMNINCVCPWYIVHREILVTVPLMVFIVFWIAFLIALSIPTRHHYTAQECETMCLKDCYVSCYDGTEWTRNLITIHTCLRDAYDAIIADSAF